MALKLACLVQKNVASGLRCGSFSCTSPSLSSLLEFPREDRGEEWTQCALRIGRNTQIDAKLANTPGGRASGPLQKGLSASWKKELRSKPFRGRDKD